jgi:hypothetical protein
LPSLLSALMKLTSSTLRVSSPALALMRLMCAARSSSLRWCLSARAAAELAAFSSS